MRGFFKLFSLATDALVSGLAQLIFLVSACVRRPNFSCAKPLTFEKEASVARALTGSGIKYEFPPSRGTYLPRGGGILLVGYACSCTCSLRSVISGEGRGYATRLVPHAVIFVSVSPVCRRVFFHTYPSKKSHIASLSSRPQPD